jgi:hypothetical protein
LLRDDNRGDAGGCDRQRRHTGDETEWAHGRGSPRELLPIVSRNLKMWLRGHATIVGDGALRRRCLTLQLSSAQAWRTTYGSRTRHCRWILEKIVELSLARVCTAGPAEPSASRSTLAGRFARHVTDLGW